MELVDAPSLGLRERPVEDAVGVRARRRENRPVELLEVDRHVEVAAPLRAGEPALARRAAQVVAELGEVRRLAADAAREPGDLVKVARLVHREEALARVGRTVGVQERERARELELAERTRARRPLDGLLGLLELDRGVAGVEADAQMPRDAVPRDARALA